MDVATSGTSDAGSVRFSVGNVDVRGSVAHDREIRSSYAFVGGSGTFDLSWDPAASAAALALLAAVDGPRDRSVLTDALRAP